MPDRLRVVITDFLTEAGIESAILADLADVQTAQARTEEELAGHLAGADALIVYHEIPMLTELSFGRARRCLGLVRGGVGFNNIDLAAAGRRGIVACNVPDYGTEDVADHAMALLLAVVRQVIPCDASIRSGAWDIGPTLPSPRLRGKTLGLVGCGRIGTAMALRGRAFGLDIVFFDPLVAPGYEKALGVRRAATLDELLGQSHFVSLHCYLSPSTLHLIDARALARMPDGSVLVNTARGPLVDQEALIAALDSGRLLGAGLDVVEREPLDDDRLRHHPRVVLTPHSAFYTVEGSEELRRKTAEEARRLLLGQPPRCPVNRDFLVAPRTPVG